MLSKLALTYADVCSFFSHTLSKLKEEQVSLSQLAALELELRRVHSDTNSLSQGTQFTCFTGVAFKVLTLLALHQLVIPSAP
jgi:hypothetical protein